MISRKRRGQINNSCGCVQGSWAGTKIDHTGSSKDWITVVDPVRCCRRCRSMQVKSVFESVAP